MAASDNYRYIQTLLSGSTKNPLFSNVASRIQSQTVSEVLPVNHLPYGNSRFSSMNPVSKLQFSEIEKTSYISNKNEKKIRDIVNEIQRELRMGKICTDSVVYFRQICFRLNEEYYKLITFAGYDHINTYDLTSYINVYMQLFPEISLEKKYTGVYTKIIEKEDRDKPELYMKYAPEEMIRYERVYEIEKSGIIRIDIYEDIDRIFSVSADIESLIESNRKQIADLFETLGVSSLDNKELADAYEPIRSVCGKKFRSINKLEKKQLNPDVKHESDGLYFSNYFHKLVYAMRGNFDCSLMLRGEFDLFLPLSPAIAKNILHIINDVNFAYDSILCTGAVSVSQFNEIKKYIEEKNEEYEINKLITQYFLITENMDDKIKVSTAMNFINDKLENKITIVRFTSLMNKPGITKKRMTDGVYLHGIRRIDYLTEEYMAKYGSDNGIVVDGKEEEPEIDERFIDNPELMKMLRESNKKFMGSISDAISYDEHVKTFFNPTITTTEGDEKMMNEYDWLMKDE